MLIRPIYNADHPDFDVDIVKIVLSHQHDKTLADMLNPNTSTPRRTKQELCEHSRVKLNGCIAFFEALLESDKTLSPKAIAVLKTAIEEDETHLVNLQQHEDKQNKFSDNSNRLFNRSNKDEEKDGDEQQAKRKKESKGAGENLGSLQPGGCRPS